MRFCFLSSPFITISLDLNVYVFPSDEYWLFIAKLMDTCHSGFGLPPYTADLDPPGPDPLADMDPLSRIWTPLKISVLLLKVIKFLCIMFFELEKRQNENIIR